MFFEFPTFEALRRCPSEARGQAKKQNAKSKLGKRSGGLREQTADRGARW